MVQQLTEEQFIAKFGAAGYIKLGTQTYQSMKHRDRYNALLEDGSRYHRAFIVYPMTDKNDPRVVSVLVEASIEAKAESLDMDYFKFLYLAWSDEVIPDYALDRYNVFKKANDEHAAEKALSSTEPEELSHLIRTMK